MAHHYIPQHYLRHLAAQTDRNNAAHLAATKDIIDLLKMADGAATEALTEEGTVPLGPAREFLKAAQWQAKWRLITYADVDLLRPSSIVRDLGRKVSETITRTATAVGMRCGPHRDRMVEVVREAEAVLNRHRDLCWRLDPFGSSP